MNREEFFALLAGLDEERWYTDLVVVLEDRLARPPPAWAVSSSASLISRSA
ncbi:hypothetical protein [Allonocardiopsis opalescens]|uniref:hypothetical protein n=1 Tax=Allonocardiopsis opalescens TaxID=1144618 RepID=UPI0014736DFC|nr:hypothetical protein [Allonocardiopsis opalescens]